MKYILYSLIFVFTFIHNATYAYDVSTKAAVALAGGIIKAQHTENNTKFKRKNCPVCKGKGWYISGDKISKVECGYCEPESSSSVVEHPPIIIQGQKIEPPVSRPLSILKR